MSDDDDELLKYGPGGVRGATRAAPMGSRSPTEAMQAKARELLSKRLCLSSCVTEVPACGCVVAVAQALTTAAAEADKAATERAEKRYQRLLSAFGDLQAAAQKVWDETNRIHDTRPWPSKYCAPYGAIVELRDLLLKQYGAK